MQPTQVAVIGCGRIANDGHLPAYRTAAQAGLCTLVGVCDVVPERARQTARRYGTAAFETAEDMIAETQPEAVSITTMPSSHHQLTLHALNAGCHVLCEKPVAMNLSEAEEMVQAAERAGRLLSICFEYRYWDRIFRSDEVDPLECPFFQVARIDVAGCYTPLVEPVYTRNGPYYAEFFRVQGDLDTVRSFYTARTERHPHFALNLLVNRIGKLGPEPGGLAIWQIPDFVALGQIAQELDGVHSPIELVTAGTYMDFGHEIL